MSLAIRNISGNDLVSSSSLSCNSGVADFERDTGDGGADIPALKNACLSAFFCAFISLSASSFAPLSSLACWVKFGFPDLVDDVDQFNHDMNYTPRSRVASLDVDRK